MERGRDRGLSSPRPRRQRRPHRRRPPSKALAYGASSFGPTSTATCGSSRSPATCETPPRFRPDRHLRIAGIGKPASDGEEAIDFPFYVTAHEVAHQWWGQQLVGANVQGVGLLHETLAQYSALMTAEHEFGRPEGAAHPRIRAGSGTAAAAPASAARSLRWRGSSGRTTSTTTRARWPCTRCATRSARRRSTGRWPATSRRSPSRSRPTPRPPSCSPRSAGPRPRSRPAWWRSCSRRTPASRSAATPVRAVSP